MTETTPLTKQQRAMLTAYLDGEIHPRPPGPQISRMAKRLVAQGHLEAIPMRGFEMPKFRITPLGRLAMSATA